MYNLGHCKLFPTPYWLQELYKNSQRGTATGKGIVEIILEKGILSQEQLDTIQL